jgi:hypothetical protein
MSPLSVIALGTFSVISDEPDKNLTGGPRGETGETGGTSTRRRVPVAAATVTPRDAARGCLMKAVGWLAAAGLAVVFVVLLYVMTGVPLMGQT